MGIFYRRPLCIFCLLFMVTSVVSIYAGYAGKMWAVAILLSLLLIGIALMAIMKNKRIIILSCLLCVVSVACALSNTLLRVDIPRNNVQGYLGTKTVEMDILDIERISRYSSSYEVRIYNIDDEDVRIRATLVIHFPTELSVGDTVLANGDVSHTEDDDKLLCVSVYHAEDGFIRRFESSGGFFSDLLQPHGARRAVWELHQWVSDRLDKYLGADSALSKAFLIGDTSDVDTKIIRDFRRTGVSHLFAVSGLHISILAGAAEFLLRRLYVPRKIRGVTVSVLAFALLCLSGFSMSAMRSVIMCWIVYVAFLVAEDNDPLTTLFVAVTAILAIFPYSVYELGLWMSFLATLGLLTVYPVIESKIPKFKNVKGIKGYALRFGRSSLMVAAMTVTSSMFLLPISFAVFGELSIVSVPTNILLSPLNALYLILIVVVLIIGGIPVLGDVLAVVINFISRITVGITGFFSELDGATVSLRYPFAKYLIVGFTMVMCVMLVIRLKHKWLVAIPPVSLCVAFTVSIFVFYGTQGAIVKYYGAKTSEIFTVCEDGDACIVDLSGGGYSMLSDAIRDVTESGATNIQSLVFTDITSRHISTMEYLFRSTLIERVFIPLPDDARDTEYSIKLVELAEECGVSAQLYSGGDIIELCGNSRVLMDIAQNGNQKAVSLFFSGGNTLLGYTDVFMFGTNMEAATNCRLSACNTVIIGNNGLPDRRYAYTVSPYAKVIYSSKELAMLSDIVIDTNNCYFNSREDFELEFLLE